MYVTNHAYGRQLNRLKCRHNSTNTRNFQQIIIIIFGVVFTVIFVVVFLVIFVVIVLVVFVVVFVVFFIVLFVVFNGITIVIVILLPSLGIQLLTVSRYFI